MDVVFVPKTDIANFDTFIDQYIRQALPLSSSASLLYSNQATSSATTATATTPTGGK